MWRNRKFPIQVLVLFSFLCSAAADSAEEEYITVTQHTQTPRYKRDVSLEGVLLAKDFPRYMEFTLHLQDGDLRLILQKYMTPHDVISNDKNGAVTFDSEDIRWQYAAYQDANSRASVIVKCWSSHFTCTLDGTFHNVDGERFLLKPVEDNLEKHRVLKSPSYFHQDTVQGISPDQASLPYSQELRKRLEEVYKNAMTEDRNKRSALEDNEATPRIRHTRKKRQISTTCNIIEVQAVADPSVVDFFLAREFNTSEANAAINEHYIALFSDVDLRYKCLEDANGVCIRVYLASLDFGATANWPVLIGDEVNVGPSLFQCSLRIPNAPTTDMTVCFTRRVLNFNGVTNERAYQYAPTLCTNDAFKNMISTDRHDDQAVHVASSILRMMGIVDDGTLGCNNSLNFIGSQLNTVPDIPGTELNPWRFSQCSQDGIQLFVTNNACLRSGTITEEDLDALVDSRELPGKVFDLDYQCQLAFGLNSVACIGPNETSIFDVEDICVAGVYCLDDATNTCEIRTRVYTGSPCGCKKQCIKNQCLREFNISLGEVCNGECECFDPNSECDEDIHVCLCVDGFYDSNGLQPEGTCLPLIPTGDNCSLADSCLDDNADCNFTSGLCECNEGFFAIENGTCLQLQFLCEECIIDEQCVNVNGTCVFGECKCLMDQYTDECGVCQMKLPLGANCSGEEMCLDDRSCCNPVLGMCECVDGTYDSNGDMPGGECQDLVPLNENCTLDEACEDENAECVDQGICLCMAGFVTCDDVVCLPLQAINEECECSEQCSLIDGFCDEGKCKCNDTDYADQCGICKERIQLGGNCSSSDICADPLAVCDPVSETCECSDSSYDSNGDALGGMCLPLIENGDNCTQPDSCEDENAECIEDVCTCAEGFFLLSGNNTCLPFKRLCDDCSIHQECDNVNAVCMMGECLCLDDQFPNKRGVCEMKIGLGANCTRDAECLDESAYCDPITGTCVCIPSTYDSNGADFIGGMCFDLIENGDNCTQPDSCEDENAECTGDVCTCVEGFFLLSGNNTCLPFKNLCDPCTLQEECDNVNATCLMDQCLCLEDQYVSECGICKMRIELGQNCSRDAECLDENAFCDPYSETCVCGPKTFDDSGTCRDLIPNGDNCSQPGSCEDENAECTVQADESSFCTCVEGFFLLSGNNTCLPFKNLCDDCSIHEECDNVNAVCMMNQCLCSDDQFVTKCGVCEMKVDLGINCTSSTECLDDKAFCDPKLGVCVCTPGTFDSNGDDAIGGTCEDKIPNGCPCPQPNACEDENAVCVNCTCVCDRGFLLLPGKNICVPSKNIGDKCTVDEECSDACAKCIKGKCSCRPHEFINEHGICEMKRDLGDPCTATTQCLDNNAFCDLENTCTCVCIPGTFDSNDDCIGGKCVPERKLGENCTTSRQCADCNAACCFDICTCDKGFEPKMGMCVPIKGKPIGAKGSCRFLPLWITRVLRKLDRVLKKGPPGRKPGPKPGPVDDGPKPGPGGDGPKPEPGGDGPKPGPGGDGPKPGPGGDGPKPGPGGDGPKPGPGGKPMPKPWGKPMPKPWGKPMPKPEPKPGHGGDGPKPGPGGDGPKPGPGGDGPKPGPGGDGPKPGPGGDGPKPGPGGKPMPKPWDKPMPKPWNKPMSKPGDIPAG